MFLLICQMQICYWTLGQITDTTFFKALSKSVTITVGRLIPVSIRIASSCSIAQIYTSSSSLLIRPNAILKVEPVLLTPVTLTKGILNRLVLKVLSICHGAHRATDKTDARSMACSQSGRSG